MAKINRSHQNAMELDMKSKETVREKENEVVYTSAKKRSLLDDLVAFAIVAAPAAFFFVQSDPVSTALWLIAGSIAWMGYQMGFLFHAAMLLEVVALYFIAPSIAETYEQQVTNWTGATGLANRMIATGVIALVLGVGIAFGLQIILNSYLNHGNRRRWNHWFGFLIGGVEGFMVLALLVGLFVTVSQHRKENLAESWFGGGEEQEAERRTLRWIEQTGERFEGSRLGAVLVGPRPLVEVQDWSAIQRTRTLLKFLTRPSGIKTLKQHPAYKDLSSSVEIQTLLKELKDDKAVREMFSSNSPLTAKQVLLLMNHPAILALLEDELFREKVTELIDDLADRDLAPPGPKAMF
ncbi:CvpA family protein [Rhodopirellula sp.]|nr:CvpA family protein [Rhodopirellula sp.]MDB4679332.1 CvpA family protein [Rhodopirellula sp.]